MKEHPSFLYALRGRLSPESAECVLAAIETVLPTIRLLWECPEPPKYKFRRIENLGNWLRAHVARSTDWVLFSEPNVMPGVSVREILEGRTIVLLSVGADAWPANETTDDLLVACGDAARALHSEARGLIDSSVIETTATEPVPGGLQPEYMDEVLADYPLLKSLPKRRRLPLSLEDAVAVDQIRWLNYWSDDTAERMGVSAQQFANLPVALCRKTAQGWYFRLTDEPLDVRRPEHQQALAAAYEHLPTVGVRAA